MPPREHVPVYQYVCAADQLADDDKIAVCSAWRAKRLARPSLRALEAFVGAAMRGTAAYGENMSGSYNMVLRFRVVMPPGTTDSDTASSEQHVVLCLPLYGFYPPALAEMLETEVTCLQYFAAQGCPPYEEE